MYDTCRASLLTLTAYFVRVSRYVAQVWKLNPSENWKSCVVCGWKIKSQSKFGLITLTKQWYITIYCEKNRKIKSLWWFHSKFNCNIKMIISMWQNGNNSFGQINKCIDVNMWEVYLVLSGEFTMSWSG